MSVREARRGMAAPLLLLAMLGAACGTTVPQTQQSLAQHSTELGEGAAVTGGGTAGGGLEQTAGTDSGSPAQGGPSGGPEAGGGPSAGVASSPDQVGTEGQQISVPAAPGRSGPGVTATEIRVGMTYPKNGTAAESLGVQGVTVGDMKAVEQAVVDDINRNGGIAGRKLVPVYYAIDAASSETSAQIFQRQCSYFTEDNPVFAVIPSGFSELMVSCVLKAGAVITHVFPSGAIDEFFRRYPAYIEPSGISLDRAARLVVPALKAQGYFDPWDATRGAAGAGPTKVGIVTLDDRGSLHATKKVLVPALSSAGFPPEVFEVRYPQSNAEVADMNASIQAAVLRFRQRGVEHVLLQDQGGLLTLFFVQNADSQHYLPRYAATTGNAFQLLLGSGSMSPRAANGAVGVGWSPVTDLPHAENSPNGRYSNDARRHCLRVMKAASIHFQDAGAESTALSICDGLYSLRAVLKAEGSGITQTTFVAGVNALGSRFAPASAVAAALGPAQHDGISAYHYYAFVPGCNCMRYTGPARSTASAG